MDPVQAQVDAYNARDIDAFLAAYAENVVISDSGGRPILAGPEAALREVRRVLKPGASLHFLEHGLSEDPDVVKWQRRLEPLRRRFAGGCRHLTRDPAALAENAGLTVRTVESGPLPGGSRAFTEGYVGEAVQA
jgi:hypothetical protein